MPNWVERFPKVDKAGVDFFFLGDSGHIYPPIDVRSVRTWSAVPLFGKKPIWELEHVPLAFALKLSKVIFLNI